MWRLTMFLLCLTAAFSGTLLRQAEAASDFDAPRGEILHGNVIELIDGGVGDDSGATITRAGGNTHLSPATGLLARLPLSFRRLRVIHPFRSLMIGVGRSC